MIRDDDALRNAVLATAISGSLPGTDAKDGDDIHALGLRVSMSAPTPLTESVFAYPVAYKSAAACWQEIAVPGVGCHHGRASPSGGGSTPAHSAVHDEWQHAFVW